jgi:hypothetical protein
MAGAELYRQHTLPTTASQACAGDDVTQYSVCAVCTTALPACIVQLPCGVLRLGPTGQEPLLS